VTPTPTPTQGACLASANCFPKPTNTGLGATGIPAGTTLKSCGSSATLSTSNAVIDGCTYTGSITVTGTNVTIRNSRIYGSIRTAAGSANASFTIENSELGATSGCSSYEALIGVQNYTARRNYLHSNGDGFRVAGDNVTIEDNFVTLCSNAGDHSDGIQGYFGGLRVLVNHNTIDQRPAASVTAPIFFADDSESATVTNNLLLAINTSAYALRIHDDHAPDIGPWNITGNRMVGTKLTTNTECGASTTKWTDNRNVTVDKNYDIVTTSTSLVGC
jgi:hypothetical protein